MHALYDAAARVNCCDAAGWLCCGQVAKHLARLRGETVESSDEDADDAAADGSANADETADDVNSTSPGIDDTQLVQMASPQLMQLTAAGGMIGMPLQTAAGQPVMMSVSQAQAVAMAQAQQAQAIRQAQILQVRTRYLSLFHA